jgi:peptidoglycan/LPS O-acetylase OafA/YrhL
MGLSGFLPYFILSPLFFLSAQFIVQRSEFFQEAVQRSEKTRHPTLDGLRGFLALGVFFAHASCNYQLLKEGSWSPTSLFYYALGQGAVWFFFMITGFLFWSKAIVSPRLNLKKFYRGRFFRIFPLYWFSLALILLVTIAQSHFSVNAPLQMSLFAMSKWITVQGFNLPLFYGFREFPDLNGNPTWQINADVAWTLAYEVNFYLILPLLAFLATPLRFMGLSVAVVAFSWGLPTLHAGALLSFLCGMAIAYLYTRFRWEELCAQPLLSGIALLCIAAAVLGEIFHLLPNPARIFCFSIAFVIFLYGNNLWGLLTAPAARLLGTISYDIYLLHGILLYVACHVLNWVLPFKGLSASAFWLFAFFCGALTIGVSCLTHRYIEYPFLQKKS